MSSDGSAATKAAKAAGSEAAKAAEPAGSSASKTTKGTSTRSAAELERMMAELGLKEEDLDDVVYDEKEAPPEAARWMAVARVHIDKPYSQGWFFKNMRAAWDLAHDCKFCPLEDNLYTVQFFCLGDWERVMEEGPWNFRGNAVVLAEYDGVTKPSMVALDFLNIWIQIHDVPDKYAHLVKALAGRVGEVLYAETLSQDFTGNFYRVWVKINIFKPLKNAVSMIRDGERQIYKVKYERLPDWCAVCGHLGYVYKEHGDGIHPPSALFFKDLRASWSMRVGAGPGSGRGRRGGRRGGRSRSAHANHPQSVYEHNPAETLDVDMLEVNRKKHERIEGGDQDGATNVETQPADPKANQLALFPVSPMSPPP